MAPPLTQKGNASPGWYGWRITGTLLKDLLKKDDASKDDIKKKTEEAIKVRDVVRLAANEVLDLKAYEADMGAFYIDAFREMGDIRVYCGANEWPAYVQSAAVKAALAG